MSTIRATTKEMEFLFKHMKYDARSKKWKGKSRAVREFNEQFRKGKTPLSRPTLDKIIREHEAKWLQHKTLVYAKKGRIPKYEQEFENCDLPKWLLRDYPDPKDPTQMTPQGSRIRAVGLDLFTKFDKTCPETLPLKAFEQAFKWDMYVDEKILREQKKRQITFEKASSLRNVMTYAGFNPKLYKWTSTRGLKRRPKRVYLEEQDLIRYIYGLNEPDTLVFSRLGFEGGGRFSATSRIKTTDIFYDRNLIQLTETKTDTFPLKPYRPCTMDFVRQYVRDFRITGKLFFWAYHEYERRFLEAGIRAGIWRYKLPREAEKPEVVRKGVVYMPYKKIVKGKVTTAYRRCYVGKKTSSHLMKHTFVSLGSIHGLSLETLSDITATDIGTLRKWYMGTGRKKTLAEVHGKLDYLPYWDWIDNIMSPHWIKRYNQIKGKAKKIDGISRR